MRLELPKEYRLIIPGSLMMYGEEKARLLLLECFALTLLGYGYERIHQVWNVYAELSGLYTDGVAKYSVKDLKEWADKNGIIYQ